MLKLLNAYLAAPTLKNAQKIRAYDRSHQAGLLTTEQADLKASAIHHANSGKADEAWVTRLAAKTPALCNFRNVGGTTHEHLHTDVGLTAYYNLKNKAAGARQYGYEGHVTKAVNPAGAVAFRAVYQTTLNGKRYQSGKYSRWVATEDEARNLLAKTIIGALKRYDRLAQDPASRIEHRI